MAATRSAGSQPAFRLDSSAAETVRSRSPLARHLPSILLLVVGATLRVLALVAIYPGIWFPDSNNYVRVAVTHTASAVRVDGYSLFVAPFWYLGSAAALTTAQHALGLGIVALLYALLVRRGVPVWLAGLAVAPAALDAYVVDIEHMIMAETVFHATLVAAIALLLWREQPSAAAAASAGLLLGYAAVVRSVATPFVVVFVLYLLVRRVGWRRVAAFAVGWLLVVVGYATVFDLEHGEFALTRSDGRFLYGQVAPFADCTALRGLPAVERPLCPDPRHRLSRNQYVWGRQSPLAREPFSADARVQDFALRVIRAQPLPYLRLVGDSLIDYFEPGHHTSGDDYGVRAWQFPAQPQPWKGSGYYGPIRPGAAHRPTHTNPNQYIHAMVAHPRMNTAVSRLLHAYQAAASPSGEVLTPCLVVVLVALALRRGSHRLRLDAALLSATALTALAVASALSLFDYRYQLGAVLLLPPAAAFALTALRRPA